MSKSRERVLKALNHENPDCVPVDFGSTAVSGIHCRIVEALRTHYGLDQKPVKVIDTFQMLGEVDEELADKLGIDCIGVGGSKDSFGLDNSNLHEQVTPWGQKVLVPVGLDFDKNERGDVYMYAQGDRNYPPSGVMPDGCYFINAIERQMPIDDDTLNPEDNLEEFSALTDADIAYYKQSVDKVAATGRAVVASFGGAALGDVGLLPAMGLKNPKGIRSISEWYMSTLIRQDYIHEVFEKEIDLAIENYSKLWNALGSKVDVVFTCGTDFGTQEGQFCSLDAFMELWQPHYRKLNDWIHKNTTWKTMKHSCGAMVPILPGIIEAGFDIINPVQINAKDMDSQRLKDEFGQQLTFWGGGIDTQQVLPYGTPDEVRRHVIRQCEIFGKNGGFVFNSVHNVQANVPVENIVAVFDALKELRTK